MNACWNGWSLPLSAKPLDGGDLRPVVHHCEDQAGVDPASVHQNRARTARALVAALLRSRQSRSLAHMSSSDMRLSDGDLSILAVDLGMHAGGVAFVVAVVGAVTSGNRGAGGDGATQRRGRCPRMSCG
jgi:hypothetical protein